MGSLSGMTPCRMCHFFLNPTHIAMLGGQLVPIGMNAELMSHDVTFTSLVLTRRGSDSCFSRRKSRTLFPPGSKPNRECDVGGCMFLWKQIQLLFEVMSKNEVLGSLQPELGCTWTYSLQDRR